LEGFVRAAAIELPKGLRINLVSPTMLKESESQFGQFFTGMISGSKDGKLDKPTNALSWGRKLAAFTKLNELGRKFVMSARRQLRKRLMTDVELNNFFTER